MDKVLVVGATGQLGTVAVKKLAARGLAVRALVRTAERAEHFRSLSIESAAGDLTDPASLARACEGVTAIVATATAAIPIRKNDTFQSVDLQGYRNLIQAARVGGVHRFVYVSAPLCSSGHLSKVIQCKRAIEEYLLESGLSHVIFRADIFMDTAFPMMGSSIPLSGSESATILRPFPFANRYFTGIKNSIRDKQTALIPGDGKARHAFICIDDVAEVLTAAVSGPSGTYTLGGPQALSFMDVVHLYEKILNTVLRVRRTPAPMLRLASSILKPFSPAGANLMALNYIAATEDTLPDDTAPAAFGVTLTSAETFLRRKSAMAASA